jgi:Ca2+-binding RTX toxin-like protein
MPGDPKSALRVPTWAKDLIDPQSRNATGFQRAHMRGDSFWNKDLPVDDGNDVVSGGDGNDTLGGGSGNDFIAGGKGKDTYSLRHEGVTGGLDAQLGIAEFDLNSSAFDAVTGSAIEWVSEEGTSWVGVNDNDRSASDAREVA